MQNNNEKKPLELAKYYLSTDHFLTVDIGTSGMKVMEIKRRFTRYSIEKIFYLPEMNKFFKGKDMVNLSGIVETLVHILQLENIRTRKVYLSFTTSKMQSRVVKLPEVQEKEMKSFVEIEFQKQFPNNSRISDTMDYMPMGKFKKDEMTANMVLMSVFPISEASTIIKEFHSRKLVVDVIDVDAHALSNIGRIHLSEAIDKAVVEIGNDNSQIIFMRGDTPVFNRQLPYGISNIVKALQNEADLSVKDAEKLVEEVGLIAKETVIVKGHETIYKDTYNEIMDDSFGGHLNEVFRSFQFANTNLGLEIEEVILTGGITAIKGAEELSKSILDLEVTNFELDEQDFVSLPNGCSIVNNTGRNIPGSFSICLGMAIRGNF